MRILSREIKGIESLESKYFTLSSSIYIVNLKKRPEWEWKSLRGKYEARDCSHDDVVFKKELVCRHNWLVKLSQDSTTPLRSHRLCGFACRIFRHTFPSFLFFLLIFHCDPTIREDRLNLKEDIGYMRNWRYSSENLSIDEVIEEVCSIFLQLRGGLEGLRIRNGFYNRVHSLIHIVVGHTWSRSCKCKVNSTEDT
jgi:hypothetical protein